MGCTIHPWSLFVTETTVCASSCPPTGASTHSPLPTGLHWFALFSCESLGFPGSSEVKNLPTVPWESASSLGNQLLLLFYSLVGGILLDSTYRRCPPVFIL